MTFGRENRGNLRNRSFWEWKLGRYAFNCCKLEKLCVPVRKKVNLGVRNEVNVGFGRER